MGKRHLLWHLALVLGVALDYPPVTFLEFPISRQHKSVNDNLVCQMHGILVAAFCAFEVAPIMVFRLALKKQAKSLAQTPTESRCSPRVYTRPV